MALDIGGSVQVRSGDEAQLLLRSLRAQAAKDPPPFPDPTWWLGGEGIDAKNRSGVPICVGDDGASV